MPIRGSAVEVKVKDAGKAGCSFSDLRDSSALHFFLHFLLLLISSDLGALLASNGMERLWYMPLQVQLSMDVWCACMQAKRS